MYNPLYLKSIAFSVLLHIILDVYLYPKGFRLLKIVGSSQLQVTERLLQARARREAQRAKLRAVRATKNKNGVNKNGANGFSN